MCAFLRPFDSFGGLTGRGTPLPIPNREVKPARADGTRRATSRESRSPPNSLKRAPETGLFSWPLRPRGAWRASRGRARGAGRCARRRGGCVTNMRRQALLGERVDRVERLGRRARLEGHELARLVEPEQRVGEPVRGAEQLGGGAVGLELPLRREEEVLRRGRDRREHEQQRALDEAADAAALDERGAGEHDRGGDQHVAVADVRELVREHALELGRGADRDEAARDRERRAARARGRPRTRAGTQSGSRYSFGVATPASAASRPTVECSAGASPSGSSRAPTSPSTARSWYQ